VKLIFLVLASFITRTLYADTSQKTIDFLEKLNFNYYCLSREGLNKFSADAAISLTPEFEKLIANDKTKPKFIAAVEQIKFLVSCAANSAPVVTFSAPVPTGDTQLDNRIGQASSGFKQSIEGALQTWTEMTFDPINDQDTYAKDCKVHYTSDGFTVLVSGENETLREYFDKKDELSEVMGMMGNVPMDVTPHYSKTDKGLVVTDFEVIEGKRVTTIQCESEPVEGFLMLKKMVCDAKISDVPGSGFSFVLTFSNYKLNP
jgi:hypothetical protein